MSSLVREAEAVDVRVSDESLIVALEDGRTITAPLVWFPWLQRATAEQRGTWEILGPGEGIHWPQFNEDISVRWLLTGEC